MRKFAGVAAVAALLLGATVVMAASPSPSASPSASPRPSASPTARPSASPSASPSTPSSPTTVKPAATNDFTTTVRPADITGTIKVHQNANGTGTVTFKLDELINETPWSIRLDRGTFAGANGQAVIAARTGEDVQHFANDSLLIHLTKAEMSDFRNALKKVGVVAFISDGTRLSVAKFSPM